MILLNNKVNINIKVVNINKKSGANKHLIFLLIFNYRYIEKILKYLMYFYNERFI